MFAAHQLRNLGLDCQVAAIARFPEEVEELAALGVCSAFNMYEEAGAGLVRRALEGCRLPAEESKVSEGGPPLSSRSAP
jgi:hypothetical protein